MHIKDSSFKVKATGDDETGTLDAGQFDALVSVFGSVDSQGDVVIPGAFAKSLASWGERGDPIPIVWSHEWADPFAHIGHVLDATEDDDGLRVRGQLDLDNPKAEQVYRLLKGRRVTQFSFAFDIVDAAPATRDDRDVTELRELAIHEVGPCLIGANRETELLAAKAQRLADAANFGEADVTALRAAYEALGAVLDGGDPDPGSDEPEHEDEQTGQGDDDAAADDDPDTGKSAAQPPRTSPAQVLASLSVDKMKGACRADVA